MKCEKCDDVLPAASECVLCSVCGSKYHYDCSVRETKWRNMPVDLKNKWACAKCKSGSSNLSQGSSVGDMESVQADDLSNIKALLVGINSRLNTLDEVKVSVNTITASLEFLSGKYDDLLGEVKNYREETKHLSKEIDLLKAANAEKDDHLYNLTHRLNSLEQYGRKINLEIHGLEQALPDESLPTILQKVARALQVPYDSSAVQAAHRVPSRRSDRPPMLLVQFISKSTKDFWLRAGKRIKLFSKDIVGVGEQRLYFNENLTPFFGRLFQEARKVARAKRWTSVWVMNGTIRAKKSNESREKPVVISTFEDLKKIV